MSEIATEGPDLRELGTVPTAALFLGAAGALPFVAAAAGALLMESWRGPALLVLLTYGAVILSFLGGIRWGLAIAGARAGTALDLSISVAPSLAAWSALLLPLQTGMLVLAVAFIVMLILDLAAARGGRAPAWYPRLRVPLTVVVVTTLAVGALV